MTMEYWCSGDKHWASEIRVRTYGSSFPVCKDCAMGEWDSYEPTAREAKESRFKVSRRYSGDWNVMWNENGLGIDYQLTKPQAEEIAALRDKWDADGQT